MCGRFTQKTTPQELAEAFALAEPPPDLGERYNIAPSLDILAIPNLPGPRHAEAFRWGLVPFWARDPSIGNRAANARAETVADKPTFREAVQRRRCLVLADGFYEWRTDGKKKTPYWFHRPDQKPFAMAGLWETWRAPDGERLQTVCLITTDANAVVAPVHDRMPVLLLPQDWDHWLDPTPLPPQQVTPLLRPAPADFLQARPVSRFVSSAANEGPRCLGPAESDEPTPKPGLLI